MKASIYNASAGSGKTYRLAYKYVRDLIEQPLLYRNILAVTFTNKATEEMKRRILQQTHTLASGKDCPYMNDLQREFGYSEEKIRHQASQALSHILHDYSRFTILTIDKFFQRLLRAFIQELGIDIGYNLEIESSSIIDQSVDKIIEQSATDTELQQWLMEYIEERVADGKRWDIREGILALSGELFKEEARNTLQNPLSKSDLRRMITKRNSEAQQAKQRLQQLGVEALKTISDAGLSCSSFSGKGSSLAQIFRKVAEGVIPELTEPQQRNHNEPSKWFGAKSPEGVKSITPHLIERMEELIKVLEATQSAINTAKLIRENYRSYALLSDLHQAAEAICFEQNTMLLNQTSRFVEEFVRDNDAPFIYEKVGNKFSRFMIDEFQDTSRREWNNFVPLLQNAIAESRPNDKSILIVGDIKQSIYRWRGGDWRILHSDARRELGESETEVINMADNYRSLPMVVNFNNEIIDQVVEEVNSDMNSALTGAADKGQILQTTANELSDTIKSAYEGQRQNPKKRGESEGFVEVVTFEDQPPIIERICSAIDRGFKPCDIMILTRTNPQAEEVAQTLLDFKRENSNEKYRFDVMTQQALIVGYAPVSQFIISLFRLIIDSRNSLQRAIYNKFIGRDVDTPFSDEEVVFLRNMRLYSPIEAFEFIVKRYSLESEKSNIAYVQAIHEQVVNFSNNRIGDIALFVAWWEQSGESKSLNVERSEQAIEILTLHKAKGLEKRVVIIPYCSWSMNPPTSGRQHSYVWSSESEGADGAKQAVRSDGAKQAVRSDGAKQAVRSDGAKQAVKSEKAELPIEFKKEMASSAFAQDYYREQLYSHIDSVNMLYVALTRAAESLHIMIPVTTAKDGERKATKIGKVILNALPKIPLRCDVVEEPREGEGEGEGETKDISYRFGVASSPIKSDKEEMMRAPYIMDRYRSNSAELRLRMPSERYREDGEYAPRELGILMHKAFESATTIDDVFRNVELMLTKSQINATEHKSLSEAIRSSLSAPLAQEWFSGDWDRVRNECEIIRGEGKSNRRPDRVMIKGERCVVVDYKFGALHPERYERQMRQYITILREMGYRKVEGYLWFIRQGEIHKVE
ncbi:MAG: UvrD-helicase domain-containing protein [Rikenellaceae bacterium]